MATPNFTITRRPDTYTPAHPYYPLDAEILYYAANKTPVPYLLLTFFAACAALFTAAYKLTTHFHPSLTRAQLATILWFTLSGSIHIFFEGYYVTHFSTLGSSQTLIGQMWKEYAFSDSRYLTRDPFVLCVESVTAAVWGPGCFLCAWLVARGHEARWAAVVVVSLGQMYGDALYYATAAFGHYVSNVSYSRPEAVYFWFYFVVMNAFWILIPGALIACGITEMTRAMRIVQRIEHGKKAQ